MTELKVSESDLPIHPSDTRTGHSDSFIASDRAAAMNSPRRQREKRKHVWFLNDFHRDTAGTIPEARTRSFRRQESAFPGCPCHLYTSRVYCYSRTPPAVELYSTCARGTRGVSWCASSITDAICAGLAAAHVRLLVAGALTAPRPKSINFARIRHPSRPNSKTPLL